MISWDLTVLKLINLDWSNPFLDWLMPAVSATEAWTPLLVVIVLIVILRTRWRGVWLCLCIAVTVAVSDGLVSRNIKHLTQRVRPRSSVEGLVARDLAFAKPAFKRLFLPPQLIPTHDQHKTSGVSFPSSHTMNMFAVATLMALFSRRWSLFFYALAFLVAYSRLYCAAHWPSDVIPSAAMGVLIGLIVPRLLFRAADRFGFGQKVLPGR